MSFPARNAVVLLSGGIDSAVCLAIAISEGFRAHAISFNYGQRHGAELRAAGTIARALGASRRLVLNLPLDLIGGSALTSDIDVPKDVPPEEMSSRIPVTYVPARNTVFLSFALAWAETLSAGDIYIGVNALDYSGYPDCRPAFITAYEKMANLALRESVEGRLRIHIHTPLIAMSKAGIIKRGVELGVDFSMTHSCYDPDAEGRACGRCDSCALRRKGFVEAGVPDPTIYANRGE